MLILQKFYFLAMLFPVIADHGSLELASHFGFLGFGQI